jgi:hypothetical protein
VDTRDDQSIMVAQENPFFLWRLGALKRIELMIERSILLVMAVQSIIASCS